MPCGNDPRSSTTQRSTMAPILAVAPHRVTIRRTERHAEVGLAYFYKAGGREMIDALVACADIGITCLLLSQRALEDHPPATEAANQAIEIAAALYEYVMPRVAQKGVEK